MRKILCFRFDKDFYEKIAAYLTSVNWHFSQLVNTALQRVFEAYKEEFPEVYDIYLNKKPSNKEDDLKFYRMGTSIKEHVMDALEALSEKLCIPKSEIVRQAIKSFIEDAPLSLLVAPSNIDLDLSSLNSIKRRRAEKTEKKIYYISLNIGESLYNKLQEITRKYQTNLSTLLKSLIVQFIKKLEEKEKQEKGG